MRMSDLVENVSKKPIPPWMKTLLVEVMVNDENDEDVEVSRTSLLSTAAHSAQLTVNLSSPYPCLAGSVLRDPHLSRAVGRLFSVHTLSSHLAAPEMTAPFQLTAIGVACPGRTRRRHRGQRPDVRTCRRLTPLTPPERKASSSRSQSRHCTSLTLGA